MKLIFLLSCLLFAAVYSHNCESNIDDSFTSDVRWRLVSGLDAASIYSIYSQVKEMAQPLLVNASAGGNTDNLQSVIDGVCNLVSFYELVSRAKNGSQLHTLLTANVEDCCHWLHYLVSHHSDVLSSNEFAELPPSCTSADTTRLHLYCLQRKIRSEELRILIHRNLSDSLHTYYGGTLPVARPRDWVQTTSFSMEQKHRLLDII